MAPFNPALGDMEAAVRKALVTHWRLLMFQGAVMMGLGVLAVAMPVAATIAVGFYVGWLFLIGGIVGLVAMFSQRNIPAFLWSLVTAALSVTVGILLIWNPIGGAVSLTFVLTAFFIVEGVFQIATSFAYRDIMGSSWRWMLVSGIADLVLAAIIIISWPISAAWTLGLFVGINLISSGWALVMVAIAGREASQTL
jgi:uncharacterized membrane protein HdeD (DUF308 family)